MPLTICVVVLLVLHVVPPRSGLEPMLLGFLPWDLAYHLLWMFAAAAVIFYLTFLDWSDDEEPPR